MQPADSKPVRLTRHALEQCRERGTDASEIEAAVRYGEKQPVRQGRWRYAYNLPFNAAWRGRTYAIKQVVPIVAEEPTELVVVTVFTFFF